MYVLHHPSSVERQFGSRHRGIARTWEKKFAALEIDPAGGKVNKIRAYRHGDHSLVRALFVQVNQDLAPVHLRQAFAAYIARSLAEEIDRIPAYYTSQVGGFWVAERTAAGGELIIAGMFGLERAQIDVVELRRMYVARDARRQGLGRAMLARAETEAVRLGCHRMVLSTSEFQEPAIALYRSAGYRLVREEVANQTDSTKTVGMGIRRYHFEKALTSPVHV